MKIIRCYECSNQIDWDIVALNKKLLGRNVKRVLCISCLANHLECSELDLMFQLRVFKDRRDTLLPW